jgi:very-short-patch-repair endonuclease
MKRTVVGRGELVVADLGARRRGIVRTDLALAEGIRHHELDQLRRAGRLVSLGRGVDRLRDRPFDWHAQCQAALDLAGPTSALGLRTAGRLHGWYADRATEAVEVAVLRGRDHRTSVGRLVQTTRLPDDHVMELDGLRVTTPARTFFDRSGDPARGMRVSHPAHERAMVRLYNDALRRGGLTFIQELAVFSALAGRGRRGTRLVRSLLRRFGSQYSPTASDLETTFFELVARSALPDPHKQVAVSGVDGFIGVVDFLWPEERVVVEVDSSWHDGPVDAEHDAERDRRLVAAGYTVLRYRFGDIVLDPTRVLRELGAAIRRMHG